MTAYDVEGVLRREDGAPAVRFERAFRTDPADLWSAVTDPERLRRWFMPVSGDLVPGGRYVVDFGENGVGGGTVDDCDPPHGFTASWDFEAEPTSRLVVRIRAAGDQAVLILDHSRLPEDQVAGYAAGWHGYLDGLGAEVTGGPLPDWGERLQATLPTYRQDWAGLAGT